MWECGVQDFECFHIFDFDLQINPSIQSSLFYEPMFSYLSLFVPNSMHKDKYYTTRINIWRPSYDYEKICFNITCTVSVTSRLAKVLETTLVKIILSRCLFSNLGSNFTDSIRTLWLFLTSSTCTPGFMDSRSTASTRSGQECTWIRDICKLNKWVSVKCTEIIEM